MLVHSVVSLDVRRRACCEGARAAGELLLPGVLKKKDEKLRMTYLSYLCFVKTEGIISGKSFAANIAFKGLDATVQFDVLLQVVVAEFKALVTRSFDDLLTG